MVKWIAMLEFLFPSSQGSLTDIHIMIIIYIYIVKFYVCFLYSEYISMVTSVDDIFVVKKVWTNFIVYIFCCLKYDEIIFKNSEKLN